MKNLALNVISNLFYFVDLFLDCKELQKNKRNGIKDKLTSGPQ